MTHAPAGPGTWAAIVALVLLLGAAGVVALVRHLRR